MKAKSPTVDPLRKQVTLSKPIVTGKRVVGLTNKLSADWPSADSELQPLRLGKPEEWRLYRKALLMPGCSFLIHDYKNMKGSITMIKCTKDISNAQAITHAGTFHADDVLSAVIVSKALKKNVNILRTFKVPENVSPDIIVYDIGGGDFDHHQRGGNGCRENGVPYSSAGLLWRKFGLSICEGDRFVFEQIDRALIQGVDALDNGLDIGNNIELCSVSNIISYWNPNWDEDADTDDAFDDAATLMNIIFNKILSSAKSKSKAKNIIEERIESSSDGIMVLNQFCPWQDHIFSSSNPKADNIKFVIFPSNRGGYNWQCVPDAPGSFGQRKPVPAEWKGLRDNDLRQVTGIATAIFCHPAGFIGSCETEADAISMARLAINA